MTGGTGTTTINVPVYRIEKIGIDKTFDELIMVI